MSVLHRDERSSDRSTADTPPNPLRPNVEDTMPGGRSSVFGQRAATLQRSSVPTRRLADQANRPSREAAGAHQSIVDELLIRCQGQVRPTLRNNLAHRDDAPEAANRVR